MVVGVGMDIDVEVGIVGVSWFGWVKKGTKLAIPKLLSHLKSYFFRLIVDEPVVPHQ